MKLFTAEWCSPCREIKRYLEGFTHSIELVDVDLQPALVRAAGIRGVPTLLLGDGSTVVGVDQIKAAIKGDYGQA